MGKSYAIERAKFERQQRQQAELYRKLGMDEGQIQAMYDFDLQMFRSDRRYEMHTQPYSPSRFDDGTPDESKSVLFEKFLTQLSVQSNAGHSRNWWVEEIEHPQLARAIRQLNTKEVGLLTLYAVEGRNQSEIAAQLGLSQRAISKRLQRLKNYLRNL